MKTIITCDECQAVLVNVDRWFVCPDGHGRLVHSAEIERRENTLMKEKLADLPIAVKQFGPRGGKPKWHVNGKRVKTQAPVMVTTAYKKLHEGKHVAKIEGDWYLVYREIEQ